MNEQNELEYFHLLHRRSTMSLLNFPFIVRAVSIQRYMQQFCPLCGAIAAVEHQRFTVSDALKLWRDSLTVNYQCVNSNCGLVFVKRWRADEILHLHTAQPAVLLAWLQLQ
jgi:hypothetical protein